MKLGLALAGCALVLTSCGGDEGISEAELEQERDEAAEIAEQNAKIDALQEEVGQDARQRAAISRLREDLEDEQANPAPTGPSTAAPSVGGGGAVASLRFATPAAPGEPPAAICEASTFDGGFLYCWTPNDGYTIAMTADGSPYRLTQREAENEGRVVPYEVLPFGGEIRNIHFTCMSAADELRCVNGQGHGWNLPRYVGLPALF